MNWKILSYGDETAKTELQYQQNALETIVILIMNITIKKCL